MSPLIGFCKDLSEHPPLACTFSFAWLEGPMAARLCSLAEEHDWKTWPAGRLFGEEGEYRWQRTATGHIHAVLLMDKGEPPDWCIVGSGSLWRLSQNAAHVYFGGNPIRAGQADGTPRNFPSTRPIPLRCRKRLHPVCLFVVIERKILGILNDVLLLLC